ncbi:hypothetical protein C7999DRAFT_30345 [Corynascus novoguineensis]|uniref:Uncharacterized protein n=1 Tax=Corynascus novoguineensis TaxID=1126955 RepID=A0AAN7CVE8_9PEZI|nr:hypothetical protein C7999DRAFT_30345 [Corynascus novoguineensis]
MPTPSGTKDAVAVTASDAAMLVSAYTFILEHTVMLAWSMLILMAVVICTRRYNHAHPSRPFSKKVYQERDSSPLAIFYLSATILIHQKNARSLITMWIFVSLVWAAARYGFPIVFSGYIRIGNAAPVNPNAVFVPSRNNTGSFSDSSNINNLEIFNFYVPSALRSVGAVDALNQTQNLPIAVDQPETMGVDESGGLNIRIGYRYNVTGLDLGLQHYPDLRLSVEGSCITEYGWWAGSSTNDSLHPGAYLDAYIPFNNPNYTQYVSVYDGGPRAYFFANPAESTSPTNTTWAAIISSVNRTSWFPSEDPWYQTGPNPYYNTNSSMVAPYMVLPQRPMLSCWENDVWSYRGQNGSIADLPTMPGLNLSPGLTAILVDSLGAPMIYLLGTYLQVSALKSSVTALSNIIDAESSSIYSDLQRLVYASYIATINCFTETTFFAPPNGFPNEVRPGGVLLDGAADFIIFSNDIATLSVRTMIILPVLALALWILSITLVLSPVTQRTIRELVPPSEDDKEDLPHLNHLSAIFAEVISQFKSQAAAS